MPAGHARHSAGSDAFCFELYVPRGHGVQTALPLALANVPSGQGRQPPPATGAWLPAGHSRQASSGVAAHWDHSVPGGQGKQASSEAAPVPLVARREGHSAHEVEPLVAM